MLLKRRRKGDTYMVTLTRTITCSLPDKEDVLKHLEAEHKEQHFKNFDDVYDEIQYVINDYIDPVIYDFICSDLDEYSEDIEHTFLDTHPEIERWY